MTDVRERPAAGPGAGDRRPGELGARELGRWTWRQLTSMRTALVLLLLLALAAVPGSVVPQEGVDALAVSRWKADHPTLAPVYERLGLFSVYDSAWFSAIYLLLMVSLVGCIIPRTLVYARAMRAQPPAAPRNLSRLPDHRSYRTDLDADEVLDRARAALRGRRYRLRRDQDGAVSAEKGYLREAGNLLFHVSLLVVLAGFAWGSLFGYQGGVIVLQGGTFVNTAAAYDDLDPGSQFGPEDFDPFDFTVDDFDITWLTSGPAYGTAREFSAALRYRESPGAPERTYDLRVNHPLTVDSTDVFLIGHGYAPVITVRDGRGEVVYDGPTVFLPQDQTFLSYGVVKAPSAQPGQIGLDGVLFPTFEMNADGDPVTVFPSPENPLVSMNVWTGDLGLDDGVAQSVYVLDTDAATPVEGPDGRQLRIDLRPGETEQLPDGLGSVTFEGVQPWVRVQVSKTPGKELALAGVVLALVGLLGSLFIRPRRIWVRAVPVAAAPAGAGPDGDDVGADGDQVGGTMVEVGVLDRSGGADLTDVLDEIVADLRTAAGRPTEEETA
ncbi:cytochrome c biogenesis protein ResB [Nocardioides litoris]|uniref:cytochrome c biogenesis protein ResB n=1 Tax=Nocardioides litoris TaxID=1926648 RepID=UPI001FE7830F|nr:cytochrome c biogenesis protein ResB [Nocardioides litoris]